MKGLKPYGFFLLILIVGFIWTFAQTSDKGTPKQTEPTAFEIRCSICHSLSEVRTGIEKIMKEMHHKAGVEISDSSLKEIEATFTLLPVEDPHKGLFQEKCGKCHSLDKVVKAHQTKDSAEMEKIVEKMAAKKGSGISKEEIDKINQSMYMLNEIYEPDVELKKEEKK